MWKCHKCGKPVYFAERKQSLGYDWHPECLRCEECGKRLNPGQHAEHKGVPYCHVPCYGALFGPQLFGHGTRVESHKSFGQKGLPKIGNGPVYPRSHLEAKLKAYNQYYDGKSGEIRSREVNGRLILEGSLRIHWGVQAVIHLKEDDDQRTVVTVRKRNSCRLNNNFDYDSDEDAEVLSREDSCNDISTSSNDSSVDLDNSLSNITLTESVDVIDTGIESGNESSDTISLDASAASPIQYEISPKCLTLPPKLDLKSMEWDELDELLQVERKVDDSEKLYQTMPVQLPSQSSLESSTPGSPTENKKKCNGDAENPEPEVVVKEKIITRSISRDDSWIENSNHLNRSMSGPDCLERMRKAESPEFDQISINSTCTDISNEVVLRRPPKSGSTAIKRRSGKRRSRTKLKRRCSINGHFYNRETSFFTPPHGSQMSVWVTSLVNTQEVINLMLEKYKVDSDPNNFALFVVRDNGEQRRLKDEEYPLLARVLLGPHEDVVRLFLMDGHNTPEVSCEVAQFLNLSLAELRAILNQYCTQEDREINRIQDRFQEMKMRIRHRMEDLKVRL